MSGNTILSTLCRLSYCCQRFNKNCLIKESNNIIFILINYKIAPINIISKIIYNNLESMKNVSTRFTPRNLLNKESKNPFNPFLVYSVNTIN